MARSFLVRPAGLFGGLLALALLGLGGAKPSLASQFDVTTTADSGPGSLRQALLDAAAAPGADDVVVQPGLGVITLAGELSWSGVIGTNPVNIEGNGVSVDFNGASRGFVDDAGRGLSIHDMQITGVGGSTNQDAAPVLTEGGPLLVDHCTVSGNHVVTTDGDVAGAVLSEGGSITITDCTLTGNTAVGSGDGGAAVLTEGGPLDVSNSLIESNFVQAAGDAGGGLESEGGNVTVSGSTIRCNRATAGTDRDAAGGLLSEGGTVTIDGSTFAGNRASAAGGGRVQNSIEANGSTPVLTNTTVTDDDSDCGDAIESFFLPKNVIAKFNTKDPAKSKLVAAGFFDTGPSPVDLTQPATLFVGGLTFNIPGLVKAGRNFRFKATGISFTIFPNPSGSSRARFKLITSGDLTGKVDPSGNLALRFTQGAVDGNGTVRLTNGKYTISRIRGALIAPNLFLLRAKATLKGPGKDAVGVVVGLATQGVTPTAASDLTIAFGDEFPVTIPANSFVKKGDQFQFKGNAGNITRVVLDYLRETIKITGKRLDLGTFAQGGNPVLVTVGLGSDQRAVRVRMAHKGSAMKY